MHIIQYFYKSKAFLISVFVLLVHHVSDAWNAVTLPGLYIDLMNWRHEAVSTAQMLIIFGLYILVIGNA